MKRMENDIIVHLTQLSIHDMYPLREQKYCSGNQLKSQAAKGRTYITQTVLRTIVKGHGYMVLYFYYTYRRPTQSSLDSIFLIALSIAGRFFLNDAHCSAVKLIPVESNMK